MSKSPRKYLHCQSEQCQCVRRFELRHDLVKGEWTKRWKCSGCGQVWTPSNPDEE